METLNLKVLELKHFPLNRQLTKGNAISHFQADTEQENDNSVRHPCDYESSEDCDQRDQQLLLLSLATVAHYNLRVDGSLK